MNEGIENKLGAILSDPSAMAGIMNIVKGLSNDNKDTKNEKEDDIAVSTGKINDTDCSPMSDFEKNKKRVNDRNTALLLALRPFLCNDRAKKLDIIIEILKIIDITALFSKKEG